MGTTSHRLRWPRVRAVLVGVVTLFVLAVGVSHDQLVDRSEGASAGSTGVWTLVADEVPPGVLPDLAEVAVVLLVLVCVVPPVSTFEHRRASSRRDRGPPSLSILG